MSDVLGSLLAGAGVSFTTGEAIAPPRVMAENIDSKVFPPLATGHVHELYLADNLNHGKIWLSPLILLAMLALSRGARRRILWIGRRCWPSFQLLNGLARDEQAPALLARSAFLDPLTDAERFWAVGQGLRCAGVGCVVADGGGGGASGDDAGGGGEAEGGE